MIAIYLSMVDDKANQNRFERLYYKYKNLMYYIAFGVLNDEADSEDAVQEAFMRIAKNMDKVGEIDSTVTKNFVAIIAKREALRIVEKRNKYGEQPDIDMESIQDAKSYSLLNSVQYALESLPSEYGYLMNLKYVFGYSGREIAEMTDMSEVNVRQKLFRGKKLLEEMLNKE